MGYFLEGHKTPEMHNTIGKEDFVFQKRTKLYQKVLYNLLGVNIAFWSSIPSCNGRSGSEVAEIMSNQKSNQMLIEHFFIN